MKPRRVTILRKGLMVLALPLLYQALFIGLLLKRQHDHNQAQRWAVHTKDVLIQTDTILRHVLMSQSDLRGYILTGREVFAQERTGAEEAIASELRKMAELIQHNPRQQERFAGIAALVNARLDFERGVTARLREVGQQQVLAENRDMPGKVLTDQLSAKIEEFRAAEESLAAEHLNRLERSSSAQNWLLVGGLLFNVVIGALAAAMFSREIGARIQSVAGNTRRITRGEELPPVVAGSDEIAELDAKLHLMADEIAASRRRERVYQETLEHRAADLVRANLDLDQKNQEIEMFVYSVSHDLRSPLVNLQGFSKELGRAREELHRLFADDFAAPAREQAKSLVERDVAESVRYIQTAVTRLSGIIDALLRLSRAGRVEYHPKLVELAPVVARIVAAMRGSIVKCGAEITIHPLPQVWADPTAAEQIFANLIGNAVSYLDPARPGVIEIGTVERPVEGMASPRTVYVKDNGLGIAAAYLPKVFAIFQRLHGDAAVGEGVGLALVRRVVERHGGRVWVESQAGVGSVFYVALPGSSETSPLAGVAPRKESISVASRPA